MAARIPSDGERQLFEQLQFAIVGHTNLDALYALARAIAGVVAMSIDDLAEAPRIIGAVAEDLPIMVRASWPQAEAAKASGGLVGRA